MAKPSKLPFKMSPTKPVLQMPTPGQLESAVQAAVKRQLSLQHAELTVQHSSGPLPPADETAKFEAIHPGFTGKWIAMAEREQAGQIATVERRDRFELTYRLAALLAAVAVTLVLVVGGIILLYNDKKMEGFSAIGIAAASIIGSMIYQGLKQKSEK